MKQNKNNKAAEAQSPKRVSRKDLRRKRFIKRTLSLVMLIAVIAVLFYFAMKMLFVVKTIDVTGSGIFTYEEITDFLAIPEEENIFRVDSQLMADKLTDEFTYLESAEIVKRLPDRLEIKLTDSVESYYVVDGEEYKIYSQGFKFLRNSAEPSEEAIWIDADITDGGKMDAVKQMIDLFDKYGMEQITKLSVSQDNIIGAVYAHRFEIDFGTMLDMDYKIKMCKKVLEEKISLDEKGTIDATQGGEIVYKRQ